MDKNLLNIKKECLKSKTIKDRLNNNLSKSRLILFSLITIFIIIYLKTKKQYIIPLMGVSIVSFLIIILYHTKINKEIEKIISYLNIIKKYENRYKNTWRDEFEENIGASHHFLNDLNIINDNSLLKYLDFTQSLGGKRNLIKALSLETVTKKELILNQQAIKELKDNPNFVLNFQYLMTNIENIHKLDYKEYFPFLAVKSENKNKDLIISVIFSLLTIITGILTILNKINSYYFTGLFFFQLISSSIYLALNKKEFDNINKYTRNFNGLGKIYSYIEEQKFTSSKNKQLQKNIIEGKDILKKINNLSTINSFRLNFLSYFIFNIFLSLNFILLHKYYKLLNNETSDFKKSITSLEEFEKLISLTTIGFVKKDLSMPNITDDLILDFNLIKHPLLNETTCIANSFSCKKDINIITGSNMSGKTSFMKTIGINLVLAYNGTFVNAEKFTCSISKIFTSINVKDDISKGISTFYGELKRIRDILDFSEKSTEKMIVFIDEIFKGTNYNDRILGAKETLKQLANLNCIVFLTTHDFELCEIASKKIKNYHFSESYKNAKIIFDYKIKKGNCTTTNAKYLMKEMKIIKE